MQLQELKRICNQGESQFLEFKQYASQPTQVAEEVVGFLNAFGGTLLVGVKDDGDPTGLKFAEDDLQFLEGHFNKHITPSFNITAEIIPVTSKRAVIVLEIKEGDQKPYALLDQENNLKNVFYRVNDECIKASRELRNILRQAGRPRGQTIIYSDIEAAVLKEIEQHGKLTKADLVKKIEFNSRKISDCLIRLVTSKVLNITPATSGDLFEYNQPA